MLTVGCELQDRAIRNVQQAIHLGYRGRNESCGVTDHVTGHFELRINELITCVFKLRGL